MNIFTVHLVLGLLLIVILYLLWRRRKWYALAYQLKGRYGYPLIGSAYNFVRASKILNKTQNYYDRHGELSQIWMGPQLYLMVNDPVNAEKILNSQSCLEKGKQYNVLKELLGRGLITIENSTDWRLHRKLINPSFSSNVTNKFMPIFNKHMRIMSDCLEGRCGESNFDILFDMQKLAMDVICETTMDRPTSTQSGFDKEYFNAIDSLQTIVGIRVINPIYYSDFIFRLSKHNKKFVESRAIFRRRVTEILAEKIKSIEDNNMNGDLMNAESNYKNDSLIDRLLKISLVDGALSLDDVVGETNTILIAGYETTSLTSAFVMLMLAMHPDLQERVYDEIKTIPFEDGVDVTQVEFSNLNYLDMFIKETLRMFPAAPVIIRSVSADIQLGKHTIPTGVELVIGVMAMHRSKDNFNLDPNVFNPDNFLPENSIGRHPFSYIPFSAGSKICIGNKYAMNFLKLVTIYVLKKYRLSTELRLDELRLSLNITIKLLNKHLVQLHKR